MSKKKKDYTVVPNEAMSREELDIARMAVQLKAAFKDKWQAVYKRPYSKVARADTQKMWQEAAKIVLSMHGTAETYIEAQFTMSKTICLPNKLVGPSARKRYTSYLIASGIDFPTVSKAMVDTDDRIDPGKAEFRRLIAAHVEFLQHTYGIKDLTSPEHLALVTSAPYLFEPLAACAILGAHPEVIQLFGAGARQRLSEYPYLKTSMKELGYEDQLIAILTE